MRVSANGGTREVILEAEKEMFIHTQILPDGNSVLFTYATFQPHKIAAQSLKSQQRKELFPGENAQHLPTGHVVYAVGNNLFAIAFDPDKLEVAGGPVAIVEGAFQKGGASQYAVSD